MAQAENRILAKMLDRLYASLLSGPSLNCRPHSSRQRVDLTQLAKLADGTPGGVLLKLLSSDKQVRVLGRVAAPAKRSQPASAEGDEIERPEQKAARLAWSDETGLLSKLRIIAEEAKNYEDDTGAYVLNIGFPVLSLAPGTAGGPGARSGTRRILAPLAFIPVALSVKAGAAPAVDLACKEDEIDRIVPNSALLAWLERQTGNAPAQLFEDEEGDNPWKEIARIAEYVATALNIKVPDLLTTETAPEGLSLQAVPKADDLDDAPAVLISAVLGLFPLANESLLRDTKAMLAEGASEGPIDNFLSAGVSFEEPVSVDPDAQAGVPVKRLRRFSEERPLALADPCQSRAVHLARECRGLVIHGPPGTGKSQTITNIIGDHLARGQRVLFVCDKRTALDVVANRLEHLGLRGLCALIHDPLRDQRELYKSVRDQLEGLVEVRSDSGAEKKLAQLDLELQRIHGELTQYWSALMRPVPDGQASFHELMGQWLAIAGATEAQLEEAGLESLTPEVLQASELEIQSTLNHAIRVSFPTNPWRQAAGIELGDFLAKPMDKFRTALTTCVAAAARADASADASIPTFDLDPAVSDQGAARVKFAQSLRQVIGSTQSGVRARWALQPTESQRAAWQQIRDAEQYLAVFRSGPLDKELRLIVGENLPAIGVIAKQLGAMESYLPIAKKWFGVLCFGRRSQARKVLSGYGLALSPESAQRLKNFLIGLRAGLMLKMLSGELSGSSDTRQPLDESLGRAVEEHAAVLGLFVGAANAAGLRSVMQPLRDALPDDARAQVLVTGLTKSADRAEAIDQLIAALEGAKLLGGAWVSKAREHLLAGRKLSQPVKALQERLDTLEGVLRVRAGLAGLPEELRVAMRQLITAGIGPEEGLPTIRKAVLAGQIETRLRADPALQRIDGQRVADSFDRYRKLEQDKRQLVRDAVLHHWLTIQKERLLVGTGSRLNTLGADLRRRLTTRGQHAMRLRQVVALGRSTEGGDPLMDLRPVWMASPETVAQLFPREAAFDVVIFDEASQCRLEEALPVLTRAKRVVIAGDPKQLPPTRFFESAVASSQHEEEIETDQQLFEAQQGEVEDLLSAALSLEIQSCYLDVHYRSRNADLIAFSNDQFYHSRLQPIPGHPSNRARFAPLTLHRADGVYEERRNLAEAEMVCRIVRDLLKRAQPPSIGIACFNITQRDLIAETLDELAEEDAEFAGRLGAARTRRGAGSFEGLFVKNLENVQGDERDHIIISTTYGPDPHGRFYQRFGPLGRVGGGRRLNVLVTRAREEVHLVTSIPLNVYRSIPPVPPGQTAGGGWLLFAYLHYAERLGELYEAAHQAVEQARRSEKAQVAVRSSQYPSMFSQGLGQRLIAEKNVGSDVHWGNDGFCVDLALHHPIRLEDRTVGVLCDGSRFEKAEDPVEWDVFRTTVLESQGWKLHRLWTPQFFRDQEGAIGAILATAQELLRSEEDPDSVRVGGAPSA